MNLRSKVNFVLIVQVRAKLTKMSFARFSKDIIKCKRVLSVRQISARVPSVFQCASKVSFHNERRNFSVFSKSPDYNSEAPLMDLVLYEAESSEALEALTDYFEELVDADPKHNKADIAYSVSFTISISLKFLDDI